MFTWIVRGQIIMLVGLGACSSDDTGDTDTDTDTDTDSDGTTTGTNGTTGNNSTTTTTTTDGSTTSSSGGSDTTTGSTTSSESSSGETGSSSGGSSGSSGGSSSSTGTLMVDYEGAYEGEFEGSCPMLMVQGTITFDVDAKGAVTGMISGNTSGPLAGAVDDMGALETTATTGGAGDCPFVGQIEDDLSIDGTWSCPDLMCTGTWTAGPAEAP